ncbi:selenium cofactor biosynthesis protein YqeC [Haloplanus aerogenes]|uniref:Putative selenium-dependent hydroxylase accessory protein YqeC n=1 Tax=Haloplanus aerogenes TaxID=660522 RepID=A0A3M0DQY2_9EURY|nr:selenium cofactor biosynthesis protein YqeC [Haloplanus aerogenes]AZH24477.1 putative selenium-dependent hydroxylase accessory protein YqeC [Haloplanus aerogenes]RMB23875.1 putative selenium-dependent hydroxylase accessory protein YqeC [Haloplanus aerogenes]
MDLIEALSADVPLVCVVGAGGKKTTLYALANQLDRAVVTATVRIPIFDEQVAAVRVTRDPVGALRDNDDWPLGLVPEQERDDRYLGYDRETVTAIRATPGHGPVLVKADGARTRLLKAPDEREPQIPATADTVIPIASARVVGEPLDDDHVHRPERVAELTGLDLGDPIRPEDVATVLASRQGGRKRVPPSATVVPLINMVDDDELAETGRRIAAAIHDRADVPRVVLARMIEPTVVDVI